jgi:hypothetical protein
MINRLQSYLKKINASTHDIGLSATIIKIFKHLASKFISFLKIRRLRKVLEIRDLSAKFEAIYEHNLWGDSESLSGPGSTAKYTENLRALLPSLISKYGVKRVFDAPCGDMNWMAQLLPKLNVLYVGGDIVHPLIELNTKRFGNSTTSFICVNLVSDRFPGADLMICRDCLFHMSYEDTLHILENYIAAGISYLLVTSHTVVDSFRNQDIVTGDFRRMDIFSEPYYFPAPPLERIVDWIHPGPARDMCLFTRDQVNSAVIEMRKTLSGHN